MDFIERHIGHSPDGGDGTFAMMIVVLAITAVVAFGLLWFHPSKAGGDAS